MNSKIKNYIESFDCTTFFDIGELIKLDETIHNFNIITSRNTGKSFSTYMYCMLDYLKNNNQFVILRYKKEQLIQSDIISTFNYIIEYIGENYPTYKEKLSRLWVRITGIFYNRTAKIASFCYFSGVSNQKSQGGLNFVKTIVFDEFIDNTISFPNWLNRWASFYKTFQRNNVIRTILLGNRDEVIESDYLNEYGIEFDDKSVKNQFLFDEEHNMLSVLIVKPPAIPSLIKSQEQFEKQFVNTSVSNYTKGFGLKTMGYKNIYSWNFYKVCNSFNPWFRVKFDVCILAFGWWQKGDCLYVYELNDRNEFNQVSTYFLVRSDCEPNFLDVNDVDPEFLNTIYSHAKVKICFSSIFGREVSKLIFNHFSIWLSKQKAKYN